MAPAQLTTAIGVGGEDASRIDWHPGPGWLHRDTEGQHRCWTANQEKPSAKRRFWDREGSCWTQAGGGLSPPQLTRPSHEEIQAEENRVTLGIDVTLVKAADFRDKRPDRLTVRTFDKRDGNPSGGIIASAEQCCFSQRSQGCPGTLLRGKHSGTRTLASGTCIPSRTRGRPVIVGLATRP